MVIFRFATGSVDVGWPQKSRIDSGPPPSALESFPAIDPGSGCVASNGVSQPYDGMVEFVCIYKNFISSLIYLIVYKYINHIYIYVNHVYIYIL